MLGEVRSYITTFFCISCISCISNYKYGSILSSAVLFADHQQTAYIVPKFDIAHNCTPTPLGELEISAGFDRCMAGYLNEALDNLGPVISPSGNYQLGYTLEIPVWSMFKSINDEFNATKWEIDALKVDLFLNIIRLVNRPVHLHLAGTHFCSDGVKFCTYLAANPRNILESNSGKLPAQMYFAFLMVPWTITDLHAPVNVYRKHAVDAVLSALCLFSPHDVEKVIAVSLIGETHHLFPNLMGNGQNHGTDTFEVTDYSINSIVDFRHWLKSQVGTVHRINSLWNSNFSSFDDVFPPRYDHLKDASVAGILAHFDRNAHGVIQFDGWGANKKDGAALHSIDIYVDGIFQTSANLGLDRCGYNDVMQHNPNFQNCNVAWKVLLPFDTWGAGVHGVKLLVQGTADSVPFLLEEFEVNVRPSVQPLVTMASDDSRVGKLAIPKYDLIDTTDQFIVYIDYPAETYTECCGKKRPDPITVRYNPLAALWASFRNQQVLHFQNVFSSHALAHTCISKDHMFNLQVFEGTKAGASSLKFSVDTVLDGQNHQLFNPGVSMYGGQAYGDEFFRYMQRSKWTSYGIGELNQLSSPQHKDEIVTMLNRHRLAGARYIAPYFLSMYDPDRIIPADRDYLTFFLIHPNNPRSSGREFYHALAEVMKM